MIGDHTDATLNNQFLLYCSSKLPSERQCHCNNLTCVQIFVMKCWILKLYPYRGPRIIGRSFFWSAITDNDNIKKEAIIKLESWEMHDFCWLYYKQRVSFFIMKCYASQIFHAEKFWFIPTENETRAKHGSHTESRWKG